MNGQITTLATVTFRDIFPDEQKPEISDLLREIPSCTILTIIAHFMAQIHTKEVNFELQ
jgi:hypothetical protein